ncbi:MAG: hypothetical protein NT080_08480 [Spirochaetes bacterium]|nr:hypothetical protein [Spirochaetota bacterium]
MTKERIPDDAVCVFVRSARLELWLRMSPGTVAAAYSYAPTAQGRSDLRPMKAPPAGLEWKIEAFRPRDGLHVSETLATEPYVIDIDERFTIHTFDSVSGSILLPPAIRVFDGDGRTVFEIPTVPHKDAWYGDPREGVPGASVRSPFIFGSPVLALPRVGARAYGGAKSEPAGIICPVTIRNDMGSAYDLQRLCIPTEGLALYRASGALVCDRILVAIHVDGVGVDVRPGMVDGFDDQEIVEKARTSPEARFFNRGLSIFLKLAGR